MNVDIAAQLRTLRRKAGSPSIREIARLIASQGRRHQMARSTIQDKLSGKNPATTAQVLSIVEALAEYARSTGFPLAPADYDSNSWREEVAKIQDPHFLKSKKEPPKESPTGESRLSLDLAPFRHGGMTDVVLLIEETPSTEAFKWLPDVIESMRQVQMDTTGILQQIAKDAPENLIRNVSALHERFPPEQQDPSPWSAGEMHINQDISKLLVHAARAHSPTHIAPIIVGLRRAKMGIYAPLFMRWTATWHLPGTLKDAAGRLRSAGLSGDARFLYSLVGKHRSEKHVYDVVKALNLPEDLEDRKAILQSTAASSPGRMATVAKEIEDDSPQNRQEMLTAMITGIPYGMHEQYAEHFSREGLKELSNLALAQNDEPPF
ncbi:hypothetical protein [Streptomyces sp. BE303]|uniref:hypothetical protein n=1 Tax=Streptomyces sp. BE303 TaxID=3002528 RepID=UPI002E77AECF|nr:hypothetical protein [Streptomyces sp. BE303]MED7951699.1 hypothetical protein [Streptomyces sp. BE303]